MSSLQGKAAVITGGGGGIGGATALVFARRGAKLFLVDRDEAALAQALKAVEEAGAEVATHVADVTRSEDVQGFLCSDEASFVNGVGYPVDGGALAVMANS